jgi:hemoglobin-like flavoprotein
MKLLLAVALLGCMVAWAYADDSTHEEEPIEDPTKHSCGPLQKFKIKRQWRQAFGEGKHRLEFALHFWTRFFKGHPKDREGFKDVRGDNIYSPQFQAFGQRRLNAFGMVVDTSDDPEALKVVLEYVKADDKVLHIKPEFYEDTRDALMETLGEYLGSSLDWDAWIDCLNTLMAALK